MTLSRTLRSAAAAALVAITLAGCGGSGSDGADFNPDDFTSVPAKGLPAATAVTPDEGTVPAGEWGVIKYAASDGTVTTMALKITDVKVGKEGALKDLRGVGDMSTTTPYYVSYSWSPVDGDPKASPNQSVGTPEGSSLLVPRSYAKCKFPAALDYTGSLGDEQHGCAVFATQIGAPTALVFNSLKGSKNISFALPPGA